MPSLTIVTCSLRARPMKRSREIDTLSNPSRAVGAFLR